jgi:hypothetical protein
MNNNGGEEDVTMMRTITFILLGFWILGIITAHTIGGVIHILPVIIAMILVIKLDKGRRICG